MKEKRPEVLREHKNIQRYGVRRNVLLMNKKKKTADDRTRAESRFKKKKPYSNNI